MTVQDSYHQTDSIEKLRQAVSVYREALSDLARQREALKIEVEIANKRSAMWFHNFSCTQYALICTRLGKETA